MSVDLLQWIGATAILIAVIGVWVALYFVRGALRHQRAALAVYWELVKRLDGDGGPPGDAGQIPGMRKPHD